MTVEMVPGKGPHFPDPLNVPADLEVGTLLEVLSSFDMSLMRPDFQKLTKDVDVDAALGYVYDALRLTRETIENKIPIYGFCGGPWTVMTYMLEGGGSKSFSKAKGWLYAYPEAANDLLDLLTDTSIKYFYPKLKRYALARLKSDHAGIWLARFEQVHKYYKYSSHGLEN